LRATALLAVLTIVQIADLAPLIRTTRKVTTSPPSLYSQLGAVEAWRSLVHRADRVYLAPGIADQMIVELGYLAVPEHKPLSWYPTGQDTMPQAQRRSRYAADAAVARGELNPGTLYVLDDATVAAWDRAGAAVPRSATRVDGILVVPPAS
jgi:hypothetical protein